MLIPPDAPFRTSTPGNRPSKSSVIVVPFELTEFGSSGSGRVCTLFAQAVSAKKIPVDARTKFLIVSPELESNHRARLVECNSALPLR